MTTLIVDTLTGLQELNRKRCFPMPGDRCGLKIGKRQVNGLVVGVALRLNLLPRIHVRVNQRAWKTKYGDYHVSVTRLSGWSSKEVA